MTRFLFFLAIVVVAGALAWGIVGRLAELDKSGASANAERLPVPVRVGAVEHGSITLRRTFSGTLEASAEFVAAPKVGGRLKSLAVDLGDTVQRGQVVAILDDDELVQAVYQVDADLAVAEASHAEAKSALEIALRGLNRAQKLSEDGVSSDAQLDAARSEELARRSHVEVAKANVARAEASLASVKIRLGYARVTADWTEGDDQRIVAERLVDEGGTVSANTPLLSIVDLNPIVAVVNVPERDYARLAVGQSATLSTDSYPSRSFVGSVIRIAPVFRRSTRQARVELHVKNDDEDLKPGMFVRATLELESVENATIVPFDALTERGGMTGLFVLDEASETVAWLTVEVGIREGERVQVKSEGLTGRVVILGQDLCDDGSRVAIPDARDSRPQTQ